MSSKHFDYWQDHSVHYLTMANSYEKRQILHHPDGYGKKTGDCGDTVEFFLRVKEDRLEEICFETDGCRNTNACGNTIVHLAENRTIDDAWELTPEDVIDYLETLPEESEHCAELSIGAFYMALADLTKN